MLKSISGLMAARLLGSALQAVLLFVLARSMGVEDFGKLSLVLALGALAGTLSGFGSVNQALKFTGSAQDRGEARALLRVRFLTATVVGGLTCVLAWNLGFGLPETVALTVWVFSELVVDVDQAILLGQQQHDRGNALIVVRRFLPLGGLVIDGSWWGLAIGCALSVVLAHALVWRSLRRVKAVTGVVRRSLHYWGSTVMVGFQNSDVALVGAVSSSALVLGRYSVASRLSSPLNIFTQALVGVLTPKMARESIEQRIASYRSARSYCFAFGLALVLVSPILGEALVFVLGDSYKGAQVYVIGVTISVGVSALAQLNAAYLYASNAARALAHARYWSVPLGLVFVAAAALSPWAWCLALAPVAMQLVQWGATQRAVRDSQARGLGQPGTPGVRVKP
ncbi:lipopolysaccharide biosynthesis protein [Nocardioides houyundeii]|uniref:lipopolysaccharide biosynthesis protein n=1 Tax=Nocardioides houyundeii TaxID=2045452 RepID=UPI000DF23CBA|nr:lipopolysaccharide biosynthesis protein [Nocardioides houyundeii]